LLRELLKKPFPEIAMADNKTMRMPQDARLIDLVGDDEVAYWTSRFGISKERLAEAVEAVGREAEQVGIYLDEDAVAQR
jgi:hypothetical protein